VGICCGPASGIVVIDVDDIKKFKEALESKRGSFPILLQWRPVVEDFTTTSISTKREKGGQPNF